MTAAKDENAFSGAYHHNKPFDKNNTQIEDLLREIKENKELMKQVLKTLHSSLPNSEKEDNVEKMLIHLGFSPDFVSTISDSMPLQASKDIDAFKVFLKRFIKKRVHIKNFEKYRSDILPRVVSIIGSTGIGKTTTIAKIASILHLYRHKKVALLSIDTYRIGAIEQLEEYAKILRVPFEVVRNPEEIAHILTKYSDVDYILVDTIGRSPKDSLEIVRLSAYLSAFPSSIVFLAMAANMKLSDMIVTYERFTSHIKVAGLILTKVDETDDIAPSIEFLVKTGLPLVYLTTGQNVPTDIMEPTIEYLIERLKLDGSG